MSQAILAAERFYATLGLTTPAMRFVGTGAAIAVGMWLLKPEAQFYKEVPRPSKLMSDSPYATYFDWVSVSALGGAIPALFL
jgi:hypothetical protein